MCCDAGTLQVSWEGKIRRMGNSACPARFLVYADRLALIMWMNYYSCCLRLRGDNAMYIFYILLIAHNVLRVSM